MDSGRGREEAQDIDQYGRLFFPDDFRGGRGEEAKRREVLRQTLIRLGTPELRRWYQVVAQRNLERWAQEAGAGASERGVVSVLCGDWGTTAGQLTREYGKTFAVLNMANAFVAGGGYTEGMPAQEENMFRRTDCHFAVDATEFDQDQDRYHQAMTDRISAANGRVHLDITKPRICVRGCEDRGREDLGYEWLPEEDVFPFYELRAAAVDLRDGTPFSRRECQRRVDAQLDTLKDGGIRHTVLSAFGCGAFLNPAEVVADCYRQSLAERMAHFDCVAFAIFYPGYGPDNFTPFSTVLARS